MSHLPGFGFKGSRKSQVSKKGWERRNLARHSITFLFESVTQAASLPLSLSLSLSLALLRTYVSVYIYRYIDVQTFLA